MLNARNVATVLAVLFLALSFAALPGVDAGPVQTAASDLIYVPVMVTDNKGVPIATLKEADFQSRMYVRLKQLQHLRDTGKVDDSLRLRGGGA